MHKYFPPLDGQDLSPPPHNPSKVPMYYNFCRVHQTLRVTPAMEAGVTDHVWGIEDILDLLN
jgi:hypothetical protein